jgi:hypothetical protein
VSNRRQREEFWELQFVVPSASTSAKHLKRRHPSA